MYKVLKAINLYVKNQNYLILSLFFFSLFFIAQPVMVTPKPVANMKEAPRRSLNLEDYKKKRGLI